MTDTETNTAIQDIIRLIHSAMNEWYEWDWETDFADRKGNIHLVSVDMLDDPDLPREVREQAREYHAEVMDSINAARANGKDAIYCLHRKDLDGALAALEAAEGCELDYGAAPAWGPPREALAVLMGEE
jgi:hypothetical protein